MGPITLFDKSFLQSLSLDEAVWFDNFFLTNIPPIFFVETLADLEKAIRSGRTPEQEVGIIADKTPEMNSSPNMFHSRLCIGNLLGYEVPMDGRIVLAGGRPVKTADQSGIVFDIPPEAEALYRWQNGEFLIVERQFAKVWRRMLGLLDFERAFQGLNAIGINAKGCKTLEDAKAIAESIINARGYSFDRMKFVFSFLNIPDRLFLPVWQRWGMNRCPSLKTFAPYVAHVLAIEVFFYIAAASNLISRKKATDKVDLAYLFYLPFCMAFVSSDHIHRRCAPLFMRSDQEFVWGPDLKGDLQKIDQYFDSFPEIEKEKGLYSIANRPPYDENSLVARLWDRFLPRWRASSEQELQVNKDLNDHLVKRIKKFTEAKSLNSDQVDFDLSNPDAMVIQRKIQKKKGKWWQVAKDLQTENEK